MASVSMIEGLAKKFINMVPRPFYTEAAQKLVHEICETIYKDLENNGDRIPRSEIIQIVKDFVTTHLNNPPQNPTENPSGIRDAISDNLKKTMLEVYKDEKINMLLLQQILSEENGPDGIFYKSLEQSIKNTNDPDSKNSSNDNKKENDDDANKDKKDTEKDDDTNKDKKDTDKNGDTNKDKKDTDKDSEAFAKKVVNELVNTNVQTPVIKGGNPHDPLSNPLEFMKKNPLTTLGLGAVGSAIAYGALTGNDGKNKKKTNSNDSKTNLLKSSGMLKGNGMPTIPGINNKDLPSMSTFTDKASHVFNQGMKLKTELDQHTAEKEGNEAGDSVSNDDGDSTNITNLEQGEQSNIQMQHDTKGVLPYIQTNCNGSGLGMPSLGMPNMNFNIIKPILDSIRQPVAEELVKKIQERLSDKTTDSLTVKRDIYNKILLVIQAHLQSKEGKDMLLGHINEIIKPEIEKLTASHEIKKRLLNVIFKDKNSEIYKKLIEIIARHSKLSGIILEEKNQENGNAKIQEDKLKGGAPNEKDSKSFQVTTIDEVIQEFSEWLNEKIGSTQQSVIENPVGGQSNEAKQELQQKLSLADVVTVNTKKKTGGEEISETTNLISMPVVDTPVTNNDGNSVEVADDNKAAVGGVTTTNSTNLETDTKNQQSKLSNENVEPSTNNSNSSTVRFEGGNPNAKNKTKKRRTKNNKRKTSKTLKNKQKRRVTKKKNRKHNQKK